MPTPYLPTPNYWYAPCIPPSSPTISPASKPFCPFTNNARTRSRHGTLCQRFACPIRGRAAEAVGHYRRFIAEQPDASAVRWQLATALFEDKQNEAAADQFGQTANRIPPACLARTPRNIPQGPCANATHGNSTPA